jgi:hypothetical protein
MLQKQNQKIESMFQENQYLREKVSSLTAVRQFCSPVLESIN